MTAFALKLTAMISMVIDHAGLGLFENNLMMRSIGRLAFILYAFLLAESFYHLRNKPDRLKSHLIKLLILCVITEIPYNLYEYNAWTYAARQNVMFTLTLGFLALIVSDRLIRRAGLIPCIVVCLLAALAGYYIRSSYRFAGVLLIVFFYLYLQKADHMNLWQKLGVLVLLFGVYWFLYIWAQTGFRGTALLAARWNGQRRYLPGTLAAIIPIVLYNRKLGYHSRWFQILYSGFYPLQFLALMLVRRMMEA